MDATTDKTPKRAACRRMRPKFPDGMFLTEDGQHITPTADEWDFMNAMDRFKRENRRPFPTWREVLAVLMSRGWRRVEENGPPPRVPGKKR